MQGCNLPGTPFLPYHLAPIQAIFSEVKSATATGFGVNPEARGMIGMAQGVLSHPANGFVHGMLGRIVSLNRVYDCIAVDLQPQDKRQIETLPQRLHGYQPFDQRVLKALNAPNTIGRHRCEPMNGSNLCNLPPR